MDNKFGHSLIGYDPVLVEKRLHFLNEEFKSTMKEIQEELTQVEQDINNLEDKILKVRYEIADCRKLNEDVTQVLMSSHMDATEKVYEAMRKAEQIKKETREKILKREKEKEKMKMTVKRLTGEMQSIAEEYNTALEAFRYG